MTNDLKILKEQAIIELKKLEASSTAKEVAGKAIGKHGLFYITLIVVIGVVSSLYLDSEKIAAVMGLLGASLTALISMLNGIAGSRIKEDKPEIQIIKELISRLDQEPMLVEIEGEKVTVSKGNDKIQTRKP
jgi:hypothetical protein